MHNVDVKRILTSIDEYRYVFIPTKKWVVSAHMLTGDPPCICLLTLWNTSRGVACLYQDWWRCCFCCGRSGNEPIVTAVVVESYVDGCCHALRVFITNESIDVAAAAAAAPYLLLVA